MSEYLPGALSALGLGILTSVHPCPLATSVASISLLCVWAGGTPKALAAGLLYTFGRVLTYLCIGVLIVYGALSAPASAQLLRYHAGRLLGPFLIVAGMLVSGLITVPETRAQKAGLGLRARLGERSLWGGFLLGIVSAVSFCPASAGLFFGVLIPLAVSHGSTVLYPVSYGVGTGLPVLAAVVLFSKGASFFEPGSARRGFLKSWLPKAAGCALVGGGVYFTLHRVYHLV